MRIIDLHCDTLTECEKRGLTLLSGQTQLAFDRLGVDGWCQAVAVFMPDTLRGREAVEYFDRVYAFWLAQQDAHRDPVRLQQQNALRDEQRLLQPEAARPNGNQPQ